MDAICSQPEVADYVFSSEDAETFQEYVVLICALLASVVCEKIEISHLYNEQTTVGPFEPDCRSQGAKMSNGLHNRK